MNVERGGYRLHLHPALPAEAHRGQLELRTVFLDPLRTGARHRHLPLLGGSVYKSEGGSPVSFKRLLGSTAFALKTQLRFPVGEQLPAHSDSDVIDLGAQAPDAQGPASERPVARIEIPCTVKIDACRERIATELDGSTWSEATRMADRTTDQEVVTALLHIWSGVVGSAIVCIAELQERRSDRPRVRV